MTYLPARLLMLCCTLAATLSCAQAVQRSAAAPRALPRVALAEVNGQAIDEGALGQRVHQQLTQIDDAHAQERLVALWAGLEDAIGERLLASEARRRRLDVAALLDDEVHAKVGPITDREARALYDSHRALIDAPFAEAAPSLREQARIDRQKALRRALVDRLREQADVRVQLPSVHLHRRSVPGHGPTLGAKDAPVTLVVFSDFACPYSAQARRTVRRLHELYGQRLRVVHRNFPLAQHPSAKALALAGICADRQHKFWSFYEHAFAGGDEVAAIDVAAVARRAGLDAAALAECQLSPEAHRLLNDDIAQARNLGVRGTPSMFLNGMPLRGVLPLPVMQSLIEQERGRTQALALEASER